MPVFLDMLSFLWGMVPMSPGLERYLYGFGYWDLLILAVIFVFLSSRMVNTSSMFDIARRHILFVLCVLLFSILSLGSVLAALFGVGSGFKDLLKALRPIYYLVCLLLIAQGVSIRGAKRMLTCYLAGTLFSALGNLLYVSTHDWVHVQGFVVLYKSNVTGNLLGIAFAFVGLLVLEGALLRALLLGLALPLLGLLTYSKGTWLMLLLTLPSLVAAGKMMVIRPLGGMKRWRRLLAALTMIFLVGLAIVYPKVEELVKFKLSTTQLGDTAQEGGTFAARWGFVIASLQIAKQNPLLGVGVSNYGSAYDALKDFLGPSYWPTDNPHSALLYVLACMGVPAFFAYLGILAYPLRTLWHKLSFGGVSRILIVGAFATVFLLSSMTQVEILTQRFFWFFAGLVIGMDATELGGTAASRELEGSSVGRGVTGS